MSHEISYENVVAGLCCRLSRLADSKTGKPFFAWYNPARMHVTTMLSPKYQR
jgi:hypothetical protein